MSARIAKLRHRLSDRDMAILKALGRFRLLKAEQVARLIVMTNAPTPRAHISRAALLRLYRQKLVVRMRQKVGGLYGGSEPYLYMLSGLGWAVIDDAGDGKNFRTKPWGKRYFRQTLLTKAEEHIQGIEHNRQDA